MISIWFPGRDSTGNYSIMETDKYWRVKSQRERVPVPKLRIFTFFLNLAQTWDFISVHNKCIKVSSSLYLWNELMVTKEPLSLMGTSDTFISKGKQAYMFA